MEIPKIYESEYRFACIVWEHEPVSIKELIMLCQERLEWKRTTTYTVLKKLCDKGILKTEDSVVISLIPKEEVQKYESAQFIDRTFGGSFPMFIAAFMRNKTLTKKEIEEIERLIDDYKGE
ncbi:BlaI/MecI/CopY family transcriptional regulator [Anaerocolumna sp. AGMB13025]|uniref:BlaI/MecI/CopY family transcriptional regulator n=1 Tax=Anaerocolumna sp. AGMB13025 TaxID=3039116 RepID=UPI00241E844C|nr:BlaI/MecI/CopY family transcriptional regulator [Anaerocolumna sp. AGMB13025]WFR58498.1 BlaI/MecI/CopY family transcriptional regulator [Anaerocolumna sp. AGMB13025]